MKSVSQDFLNTAASMTRWPKAYATVFYGHDPYVDYRYGGVYIDSDNLLPYDSAGSHAVTNAMLQNGFAHPDIKMMMLDGNCTAGGGYQLFGPGVKQGWYSTIFCDANGTFPSGSEPHIFMNALSSTVTFSIAFDSKRGEYAVDFDLYMTNELGAVSSPVTHVTGNDKTFYTGTFTWDSAPVQDSVYDYQFHIKILKWSAPNTCAKVRMDYPLLVETYREEVFSLKVLTSKGSVKPYAYSTDAASINLTLSTEDGVLFDRFGSGQRSAVADYAMVRTYMGFKIGEIEQVVQVSTGYADGGFSISDDNKKATLKALDGISRFTLLSPINSVDGNTLYDLFFNFFNTNSESDLLHGATGITGWSIDNSLKSISTPAGGATSKAKNGYDWLKESLSAGFAYIEIDSDGIVHIKPIDGDGAKAPAIPKDIIYSSKLHQAADYRADGVAVTYGTNQTYGIGNTSGSNVVKINTPFVADLATATALANRIYNFFSSSNYQAIEITYSGNPAYEVGDIADFVLLNNTGAERSNTVKILSHTLNYDDNLKGTIIGRANPEWGS